MTKRGDWNVALLAGYASDGARAYVCVKGGVDVPPVLGSRSTDLRAGLCVLDSHRNVVPFPLRIAHMNISEPSFKERLISGLMMVVFAVLKTIAVGSVAEL